MSVTVVDETGGLAEGIRQFVAVVGDFDHGVSQALAEETGCDSDSTTLVLDNRYYSAAVTIQRFRNAKELIAWEEVNKNASELKAVVVRFSTKKELEQLGQCLHPFRFDVKMVIIDMDFPSGHKHFVQKWGVENGFELIFVGIEAMEDDSKEYNEKSGMARAVELLHTVNWPHRQQKMNKLTGKADLDKLLAYLNSLSGDEENVEEPDSEDEDAIWSAFSGALSNDLEPNPSKDENESVSNDVTIEVTLSNEKVQKDANVNIMQNNQSEKSTSSSNDEMFDNSVACDNKYESGGDVLDTLIRDVMDGSADFAIGDMKEIREQISRMPYDDKSRIDKAEAIVTRIAEKLTGDPTRSLDKDE